MCGPAAGSPDPVQVQLPPSETVALHSTASPDVTVTVAPGSAEPETAVAASTVSPAAGEATVTGGAKSVTCGTASPLIFTATLCTVS
ncbi:hypothetical protein [Streptomyces sp. NBC_01589]|uniref:hypothetical protein n=1 Tax=unclassified Streptomyces TaxID=2593676 RepID=UPI00386F02D3